MVLPISSIRSYISWQLQFYKEKKALALNQYMCFPIVFCLWLILFHSPNLTLTLRMANHSSCSSPNLDNICTCSNQFGATTLCVMTFRIMALSILNLIATLSINYSHRYNDTQLIMPLHGIMTRCHGLSSPSCWSRLFSSHTVLIAPVQIWMFGRVEIWSRPISF